MGKSSSYEKPGSSVTSRKFSDPRTTEQGPGSGCVLLRPIPRHGEMRECSKSDCPQGDRGEAMQCRLVGQAEKRPFIRGMRQESPLRVGEDEITGPPRSRENFRT